jgi:hypothetical protein
VVAWKGADSDRISLGIIDLAWTHAGAVYAALAVDALGTLNLAWLDVGIDAGWQGPLRIGDARLAPGGNVTLFEQGDRVRTALSIGADGTLNVAWLELGGSWQGPIAVGGATLYYPLSGWQGPVPFGSASLVPGAPVSVFRQSENVITAYVSANIE